LKRKEIAKLLNLTDEESYEQLKVILWDLQQSGVLVKSGKKYSSISKENEYFGIIKITNQGYGILKCSDERFDELIIEEKYLSGAENEDKVKVILLSIKENIALGKVIEVIEPSSKTIKGKLLKKGKNYFIQPEKKILKKIIVKKAFLLNALPGDVVETKILKTKTTSIQVKVTKIISREFIGDISYYNIYKEYNLTDTFPIEVQNEINEINEELIKQEIPNRLDLREELIFTIDPEDAKDYDDAISLKILPDNTYELGVHIADVSFFVKENSKTDKEAFLRGTSIYLPGKSIPMLPHKLTNEICSLEENKDRLTFSIIINITKEGEIISYKLQKSVIRSKKRFTYSEAQQYINDYNPKEKQTSVKNSEKHNFSSVLYEMNELRKKLYDKRKLNGSLDFNSTEPFFVLSDNGNVINIGIKEFFDTNYLVEEFMLLANRLVTEEFVNKTNNLPFIFRVHDYPSEEKIGELKSILSFFGYQFKKNKKITSKTFQSLIEKIKNNPYKNILNDLIIRSMAKAVYSTENIGHFGLGFKYYTHFTSPIRRYPDLVVHRLLEKQLINKTKPSLNQKILSNIALHSSETERRAMEIEREAIKIKQIQFLQNKTDMIFKAVIYNIVEFGFFIEIPEYTITGLVHIKNLTDDYYFFEPEKHRLRGKHNKKIYKLGDEISVTVFNLDLENRRIDFIPIN
jgi:ribonuclease R